MTEQDPHVPEAPRSARSPRPPRRPDASMTLIRTMMERPLDPGYRAAADRRTAEGLPGSTSLRAPRLVVAALAIGLVVGVAASNLRAGDTPRTAARNDLVQQIETRRVQVDRLSVEAQRLQGEVTALETAQLGTTGGSIARSRELSEVVGSVPLTGPGLVLTLDDAPDATTPPRATRATRSGSSPATSSSSSTRSGARVPRPWPSTATG